MQNLITFAISFEQSHHNSMNRNQFSIIMKRAWGLARRAVSRFGGRVSEFFAESLRTIWHEMKLGANDGVTIRVRMEHQTNAALLVNVEAPAPIWIAKSVIKWESDMVTTGYYTGHVLVTMAAWKFRDLLRQYPWMCQFIHN